MSFTRRNTSDDGTWQRAWTADAVVDLASISAILGPEKPHHGDIAFVTADSNYYLWLDNGNWAQITNLSTGGSSIVQLIDNNNESEGYPLSLPTPPNLTLNSRVHASGVQAIPNGASTALIFDVNDSNIGGIHSTVTNNTRFTVPVGGGGLWLIGGQVLVNVLAVALVVCQIRKNGTTILYSNTGSLSSTNSVTAAVIGTDIAVSGDYYELLAFQNTGGSQNTAAATDQTYGFATRLQAF